MKLLIMTIGEMRSGTPVNIAVIGTQTYTDEAHVFAELDFLNKHLNIVSVITGKAKGPDTFGENWGRSRGKNIIEIPADWNNLEAMPCKIKINKLGKKYNCLAGLNRNTDIVTRMHIYIAFWDGKSPGTKDTIKKAKDALKIGKIVYF